MSVDPSDLPRPFGPYTLLRLIAQGGMGAVFLALRPIDDDDARNRNLPEGQEEVCVVKTVRADLKADREAVGRFLDEARVVQKLSHPRIARTLDAGVIDKTYFLCLEFISGRNLRDVQTRAQKLGRALPEELIFHVLADMLEALDYAHRLKDPETRKPLHIVHRDVSPHNVMLGFDGNTRLIDFGLAAHELKRELTRPGVMVGKLRYNAPEQVRDRALDGRSDIYSAGVVLYEFIANERFYEGLTEEQVWRVAMKGDHRPRSWRDIDGDLRNLLDVALQNDPEKRYRTAREFRAALLDVAEARNVDIKNMRRVAGRFMREIFAEEQAAEREMILQATGIAEARTRLFRSPSELQSAIGNLGALPSKSSSAGIVDLKTEILDGAADHLRELRDMMSRLADPNAETELPMDPISGERSDAFRDGARTDSGERFHVDRTPDDASRVDAARDRARLGGGTQSIHDADIDESSLSARIGFDDDPGVVAETRVGRHGPRPSREASMSAPSSPAPTSAEPNPPTASGSRPSGARARPEPLPPLPPKRPSSSPITALLGGLLVVAVIGGATAWGVARFTRRAAKLEPPSGDAGVVIAVPADVLGIPDAGDPPVPRPTPPAPSVVDAGVTADDREVEDAGGGFVYGIAPAEDEEEPRADTRRPAKKRPPSPPPGPPKKTPKGLKDQVDYLKQYCIQRVACARSIVESSAQLMSLTPDELRDLKEEAPRCIERCQR